MSALGADPIFLVGTGRCGSTIIYSCLAMHPELAWIPSWLTSAPSLLFLAAGNRLWDLPGTDRFRETRFFPKPVEPNQVYLHWCHYRPEGLTPELVAEGRDRLVPAIERIRRWHGKPRYLSKMVGRPVKVEYFRALFPTARFVHITRDLKPTASSLIQVDFYRGEGFGEWPWTPIPGEWLHLHEARGRPAELTAGITVLSNLAELQAQLARIPGDRVMELTYVEFIQQPIACLERLGAWAGLPMPDRYLDRIRARQLHAGTDSKWKKFFSAEQQRNLDDLAALATVNPRPAAS